MRLEPVEKLMRRDSTGVSLLYATHKRVPQQIDEKRKSGERRSFTHDEKRKSGRSHTRKNKRGLAAGQWLYVQILPLLPYYLAFLDWKMWDTQLLLCGNECFKSEFQVTRKRYPYLRRICTSYCRQKLTQIDRHELKAWDTGNIFAAAKISKICKLLITNQKLLIIKF
jgi:hypothetical protein